MELCCITHRINTEDSSRTSIYGVFVSFTVLWPWLDGCQVLQEWAENYAETETPTDAPCYKLRHLHQMAFGNDRWLRQLLYL